MGITQITKLNGETIRLNTNEPYCYVKEATLTSSLMGDDYISLKIVSDNWLSFSKGDKITVGDKEYSIRATTTREIVSEGYYNYEPVFYGVMYDLMKTIYRNCDKNGKSDKSTFDLTYTIKEFVQVLIYNMERDYPGVWKFDEDNCPETETKTIQFSGVNCLQALQTLCNSEQFNLEFQITQDKGVRTIHIGKFGKRVNPPSGADFFEWGKGNGLYNLKEQKIDDKAIITRLWAEGGTTNIRSDYRDYAERLQLPYPQRKNQYEHTLSDGTVVEVGTETIGIEDDSKRYIEDAELRDKIGSEEDVKTYDDIYPTRTGTVTAVVADDICAFIDDTMDFDLNEKDDKGTVYLVDGTSAKITFTSGRLAGQQFELESKGGYNHETKKFRIIPFTDNRGLTIPSAETQDAYKIEVGNTYKITDIYLPESYVQKAEENLWYAAMEDFETATQAKAQYTLTLDRLYFLQNLSRDTDTSVFEVGDYVPVKDTRFGIEKHMRIQKITRNLLLEQDYQITLADTTTVSIQAQTVLTVIEHENIINNNHLRDLNKARANWRTTQELLNMVFDGDGYFDTENIKPNSIETMMLSVGNRAGQMVMRNVSITANHIVNNVHNPNYLAVASHNGTLIHYAIEDDIRAWNVVPSPLIELEYDSLPYYLYASCQKQGDSAVIEADTNKRQTDDGISNGYYNFLVGIVSSIYNDYRDITLTYGTASIVGRSVNCGVIKSADGSTYFDLDAGEIGGTIKFKAGDSYKSVSDAVDGLQSGVDGLEETVTGQSANITTLLGDTETLKTTTSDLQSTTVAQGTSIGELQSTTGTLQTTTDDLKTTTKKQGEQITDINANLVEASESIASLNGKVTANSGDITDLQTDANAQKASIESLQQLTKEIQEQIDGTVEYWTSDGVPTLANYPANLWTTDTEKAKHLGDIYTDTTTGLDYRFKVETADGTKTYGWTEVASTGIGTAIQTANKALNAANGKSHVYVTDSFSSAFSPTDYKKGDIWLALDTMQMRTATQDCGGTFSASDWRDVGYTDDTAADAAQNTANSALNRLNNLADDGMVTPTEKIQLKKEMAELALDYAELLAQANAAGTATVTVHFFEDTYSELKTYTDGLLLEMTKDSYIDRDTYNGKFTAYFSKRGALVSALTNAKSRVHYTANANTKPTAMYYKGDLWVTLDTYTVKICVATRTDGAFKAADWKDAGYAGSEDLKAYVTLTAYDEDKKETQKQIDGKVECWYTATDPSTAWTEAEMPQHVGDQWYDTGDKLLYRYVAVEGELQTTYSWERIESQDAIDAQAAASAAQDTADGKRRVFTAQPTPPYDVGDLWAQGADGDLMRCTTAKAEGEAYAASDWTLASKYTDDTTAEAAQARLAAMADDDVISIEEKVSLKDEMHNLYADYTGTKAKAEAAGCDTTAYQTAYTTLTAYTGGLLADMATDSTLSPESGMSGKEYYNSLFAAYYEQRAAVLADMAKSIADSSAETAANKAVDGLEIGQGNYIRNGAFFSDFGGWYYVADTAEIYQDGVMGGVLRFGKSDTSRRFFLKTGYKGSSGNVCLPDNTFREGRKYTLAFWVKASEIEHLQVGVRTSSSTGTVADYADFYTSTSWQRIVYTFTASGNSVASTAVTIRSEADAVFAAVMFTKFVLVEGTKAPEWTDCAQDMVAKQTATEEQLTAMKAQQEANTQTLAAITENETTVEGGLILTTMMKLGATEAEGLWTESAGIKARLESDDEVAAYFGGTLAEAIAGTKDGMTVIYHNGKMKAYAADIKGKVTANEGEIGGLAIHDGYIGAAASYDEGGASAEDSISIAPGLLCMGGKSKWIGFGDTISPTSGTENKALLRVVNKQDNPYDINYGALLDVSGGQRNYAVSANAPIKTATWTKGYGFHAVTPDANTCVVVSETWTGNPWLVIAKYDNSNGGVGLPKHSNVATLLNISADTPFAIKITIIAHAGSTSRGYVTGRLTQDSKDYISGMDSAEYPYVRDNDGNHHNSKIEQAKGDIDEFMLVYYGKDGDGNDTDYDAYWLTHRN